MSTPNLWDHVFVAIVFLAYPIYTWWTFSSFIERAREKGEAARLAGYRETIATWLTFSVVLVVIWLRFDRDWADLGLKWGEPSRLAIGVAVGFAVLWGSKRQLDQIIKAGSEAESDRLGDVMLFMPRSRREAVWFRAVSVNAGITEELLFRGFLLWYFEPWVGPTWAAVLTVVAFVWGHIYQGFSNVPGIALAAACFVGLYLLTGSLLVPIVVHVLADWIQGDAFARLAESERAQTAAQAQEGS